MYNIKVLSETNLHAIDLLISQEPDLQSGSGH